MFFWEGTTLLKQFLSGAFLAIVMTGLDQDMMQSLSCKVYINAKEHVLQCSTYCSQCLFSSSGAMLYLYAEQIDMDITKGDDLFPSGFKTIWVWV